MEQDASSLQRETALPPEDMEPRMRSGWRDPTANPFCSVEDGGELPAALLPENLRTLLPLAALHGTR